MTWRYEDGGPQRRQQTPGGLGLAGGGTLEVTTRIAPVTTMVVHDLAGAPLLLRHGVGEAATALVERIDPVGLEALDRSPELPAGPVWPGGLGVADDGSVLVVFGNHVHRLDGRLRVEARRRLPRELPYNSFVPLPDGALVTKDFGGSRPGTPIAAADRRAAELVVLRQDELEILDRLALPEPSIGRLSADGGEIYVVGDTSLMRVHWSGGVLEHDDALRVAYRNLPGQTYGWDCVIAAGAAWFLDDGEGTEAYSGTLRGHGVSRSPLHLVRVDLAGGDLTMAEVCGLEGGLVANPPVVDERRGVVMAYDSGNGVVAGFDLWTMEKRWQRSQDHGSHLLLYEGTGEVVTGDGADVVVLDITTGAELARVDSGLGMQSVLFPAPGHGNDFYVCSFSGLAHVVARAP